MTDTSRRIFLRAAGAVCASVGPAAGGLALSLAGIGAAAAQTTPAGYRALVCVFLQGGNDHANTVLATDPASWAAYRAARARPPESIALDAPGAGTARSALDIVPVTTQPGRSFALHPSLATVRTLFQARRAAVLANVGPLVMPTTRAQYLARSVPLPPKLASHNDQQSCWQALAPEGAHAGWGGLIGDLLASGNADPTFTTVSASGNAVFLAGRNVAQYRISRAGAVPVSALAGLYGSAANDVLVRSLLTSARTNLLEKELVRVQARSIAAHDRIASALPAASTFDALTRSWYPAGIDALGSQLLSIARMIAARGALGARRQVFFASMPGFDHHSGLAGGHGALLSQLGRAIGYFDALMAHPSVAAANDVTTFTASEFGRTLSTNGDGSDHGWGGHHFVMGGAVRGGDIYGRFPATGVDTPDDIGHGALLPSIAVEQLAWTLGGWMGVSAADLASLLPNARHFTQRDLGFLRT